MVKGLKQNTTLSKNTTELATRKYIVILSFQKH